MELSGPWLENISDEEIQVKVYQRALNMQRRSFILQIQFKLEEPNKTLG